MTHTQKIKFYHIVKEKNLLFFIDFIYWRSLTVNPPVCLWILDHTRQTERKDEERKETGRGTVDLVFDVKHTQDRFEVFREFLPVSITIDINLCPFWRETSLSNKNIHRLKQQVLQNCKYFY